MSAPWMKFYPRDWRGDQALRAVSLAARGLWIECLCIMHEAKPYGHLVLNGNPVDDDTLARMTGVPVDEVSALMAELRQAGVLSMTGKGVVFSRRMTKDHARAQKGRKAASKRWSQASDGVQQSEAPNGSANGSPITQIPESRSHTASASALPVDLILEAAGARGPCHEGIPRSVNKIFDLIPQGYDLHRDILPSIRRVAKPEISNCSYFVKVIVADAAERAKIPPKPPPQPEPWPDRLAAFRQDGTWVHAWGPKPGEPGCKVPAELLARAA
jgi:hypothetical protein